MKFWQIHQIYNLDFVLFWLDPLWINSMGRHGVAGVSSEHRCSSWFSFGYTHVIDSDKSLVNLTFKVLFF